MARGIAHFTVNDRREFVPTAYAQSHWGDDHLNGPAVVGLAARALELAHGAPEFQPSRLTVDLFRAARGVPTVVDVRVIRDGRRVRAAECDVRQGERVVARATLVQYRRGDVPAGQEWVAPMSFTPPPLDDPSVMTLVGSETAGWSPSPAEHQNTSRKSYYQRSIDVIAGEGNSAFVRAAMTAEATSLVTNLGSRGVGYINGDLTVGLARLPVGEWVGVQADSHWAADGVAVGTATLVDVDGPFGSGMVTAVGNPDAQIDFSAREFALPGTRQAPPQH